MKSGHNTREDQNHRIADVTPGALLRWGIVISMVAGMFLISGCPQVSADSGPPWVSTTLDNLSYTEQEGWKKLDTDVTVTSDTDDFSEGYVEVNITNATSYDELRLVSGGSLSVSGDAVYWGGNRIGTINNIYDGSNGRLRIDFSAVAPLTNADFETGDLTGWTINDSYTGVTGQAWVESPADDPDVPATDVDTDPTYDDHASVTQSADVQSNIKNEGTYALKLTISGGVLEGYGTAHGPMATSSSFTAGTGDNISLNWYATGSEWYDVYGFVFKDADNDGNWDSSENYQKLFHDVGASTSVWVTTNTTVASNVAGENLRFVFLNGNYDRSGGLAIGSSLYIDGINLEISNTTVANDSIVSYVIENIEYNNTNDDPGTTKEYNLNFKQSNEGTGFNTAHINIIADTTPPASITGLDNLTTEQSRIRWEWTDPTDADFAEVMIYLNGTFETNVPKGVQNYTATGLNPNTTYTIGTHTVDDKGNVNQTWENDTARTLPFSELQRINVTPTAGVLNISESVNFNATGYDHNNDSIDDLIFGWGTSPEGVGTLNATTGSVVNFTALHAGRTEIYAVNGSVSSSETYRVWITVNAPPETGNVANGTGNATSGNSTAIVTLNNGSVNGTITIEEIGDPLNGTEDIGNMTGLGTDSEPVKGVNVTVNGSIEVALNAMGGHVHIRIEYNESQLGNIDENTLYVYKFINGVGWVKLVQGSNYCIANGRNTTADHVWVNVTNCSIFLLAGTPTATPNPSGGDREGTYPPGWFETPTPAVTAMANATATDAPPGERVTPAATKRPAAAKPTAPAAEGTTAGAAKKDAPGFTAVFVIAGMLAVAYAMMRRRG